MGVSHSSISKSNLCAEQIFLPARCLIHQDLFRHSCAEIVRTELTLEE